MADQVDKVIAPSTKDELDAAFSGAAIYVNKTFVTVTQAGLRLAFAEARGPNEASVFRSAVLLSYPDAFALLDLLQKMLKENVEFVPVEKAPQDGAP